MEFKELDKKHFEHILKKVKSDLVDKIKNLIREKKYKKARELAYKYFTLETGIKNREVLDKRVNLLFENFNEI